MDKEKYRTFTEKDIAALTEAFRCYLGAVNGMIYKAKRLIRPVRAAIEGGLGPDELLNKYNWGRAMEACSGRDTTPEQYVQAMLDRSCAAKRIGSEEGWQDDMQAVHIVCRCLHEWYKTLRPKGGTWQTENAQKNIIETVSRWGLQPIMDESLLEKALKEWESEKRPNDDMTFFNYISLIRKGRIEPDALATEGEKARQEEDALMAGDEGEAPEEKEEKEKKEDADSGQDAEEMPIDEDEIDWNEIQALMPVAEGREDEGKETNESTDKADDEDEEPMPDDDDDEPEAIIQYDNPMDTKRSAIAAHLNWMTAKQITELSIASFGSDTIPLGDLIDRLTYGEASKGARKSPIYESLRLGLMSEYMNCVAMQGFPLEEKDAAGHDTVSETWDMRDPKVVLNHKLQKLIYEYASEDGDLMDFARSLSI